MPYMYILDACSEVKVIKTSTLVSKKRKIRCNVTSGYDSRLRFYGFNNRCRFLGVPLLLGIIEEDSKADRKS